MVPSGHNGGAALSHGDTPVDRLQEGSVTIRSRSCLEYSLTAGISPSPPPAVPTHWTLVPFRVLWVCDATLSIEEWLSAQTLDQAPSGSHNFFFRFVSNVERQRRWIMKLAAPADAYFRIWRFWEAVKEVNIFFTDFMLLFIWGKWVLMPSVHLPLDLKYYHVTFLYSFSFQRQLNDLTKLYCRLRCNLIWGVSGIYSPEIPLFRDCRCLDKKKLINATWWPPSGMLNSISYTMK